MIIHADLGEQIKGKKLTEIVSFASELNEPEESASEFRIVHVFLSSCAFRSYSQSFRFRVPLKGIQIQYTAMRYLVFFIRSNQL